MPQRSSKGFTDSPSLVPKKEHRIFLLQPSSIFESYGGIEYYNDDFLKLACEIYSPVHVTTLIPQRQPPKEMAERPYFASFVRFLSKGGILGKIENRVPVHYFVRASKLIRTSKPTLILCGHVRLAPLAYLLSKMYRIPFLVTAYGIESWGAMLPTDEWAFKQANGIISISEWTKKILIERGHPKEKIKVIHPRLSTDYEKLPAPRRSSVHDPFTLLTISRLDAAEQYKGQDHVLQALQMILKRDPNARIKYIIQGDGTDRRRLMELAQTLGLGAKVEFRDQVQDRHEFEGAYRECDLFVMPSRFGFWNKKWHGEGFGIVYLEAASFGIPSVAYNCGGATDIIRHGVNGMLVQPDNIEELATTIYLLYSKHELLFDLGKKAHEIVKKHFTRNAIRREMIEALDSF